MNLVRTAIYVHDGKPIGHMLCMYKVLKSGKIITYTKNSCMISDNLFTVINNEYDIKDAEGLSMTSGLLLEGKIFNVKLGIDEADVNVLEASAEDYIYDSDSKLYFQVKYGIDLITTVEGFFQKLEY